MRLDATALIAGLSLIFIVLSAGLGLIVRITLRWGKIESNLEHIAEKVGELVQDKDAAHRDLNARIDKVDDRIERHESWHAEYAARGTRT